MKRIVLTGMAAAGWLAFAANAGFAVDAKGADNAAAPAANSADQTDNNFYWQGTQLYNLGRLGEAFESFEKAIQRKQNSKESEAYLMQIRQEIVTNARARQQEKATLNYGGGSTPDTALNVTYLQKGVIKVNLQAKYLFDENSASLKAGSMEVVNRLADLLQSKEGNQIELTVTDELDATTTAKDIDAERSLLIFALLNLKRKTGDQS
jgi:outer membrane protein OmpA-like peptidoglycan-associated protein